ncbi:hypothetical protein BJY14_007361 [Actinomadura luteofluorescens]|uniref:Uncharacterized protein n=1 Tax=Actinomadura luteofluorescens TaxID=46163 RepID=A0A7Y9EP62_9ACTN|nr:hypothetical protein [Actinomadura luteofluorescens]
MPVSVADIARPSRSSWAVPPSGAEAAGAAVGAQRVPGAERPAEQHDPGGGRGQRPHGAVPPLPADPVPDQVGDRRRFGRRGHRLHRVGDRADAVQGLGEPAQRAELLVAGEARSQVRLERAAVGLLQQAEGVGADVDVRHVRRSHGVTPLSSRATRSARSA